MEQTSFCVENIQFSVFIHSHSVRKPDTFRIGEHTHKHTVFELNNIILKTLNLKKKSFSFLSNRKRDKIYYYYFDCYHYHHYYCCHIFFWKLSFVNLEPSVSEYLVEVKKKFTSNQKLDNWQPRFVKSFLVTNLIHHQFFLLLFLVFLFCKPEKEKR